MWNLLYIGQQTVTIWNTFLFVFKTEWNNHKWAQTSVKPYSNVIQNIKGRFIIKYSLRLSKGPPHTKTGVDVIVLFWSKIWSKLLHTKTNNLTRFNCRKIGQKLLPLERRSLNKVFWNPLKICFGDNNITMTVVQIAQLLLGNSLMIVLEGVYLRTWTDLHDL